MLLFIIRFGGLCLCSVLLTGCVGASNWLSGSAENQNSLLDSSHYFSPMRIGVTTRQEIASRFGVPDDVQFDSIEGEQTETLGYSGNEPTITPFQYLPFFGAVEMWRQGSNQTPAAAISFSSKERVSGLTVSTNNAYGNIRTLETSTRADSSMSFYGRNNPSVYHSAAPLPEQLP